MPLPVQTSRHLLVLGLGGAELGSSHEVALRRWLSSFEAV